MPQRIQRKRTKDWRLPDGAVIVTRPTRWGNPFEIYKLPTPLFPRNHWGLRDLNYRVDIPPELSVFDDRHNAAVVATRLYELHHGPMGNYEFPNDDLADLRRDLAGRDLACWCAPPASGETDWCHAAVLIDIANGGPG